MYSSIQFKMSSPRLHGKGSGFTGLLILLVIVCLVQSATGSCLSYGHSCWGAHGKRSGKPLSSAPDWYLSRILRSMAANSEMNRSRHDETKNAEINDILQMEVADDVSPVNSQIFDNADSPIVVRSRNMEAKPMLDDNMLANMKMWQLLRQTSNDK